MLILLPHPLFPFFCPSPSFLLYALPILLPSLSPFFCPSYFFPLFGVLILLPFSFFPSFYPACSIGTHTFLISLFYVLLQHTSLVLLSALPILSHTHSLYLLLPLSIPFILFHVATHTPIFFLSQTQKGQKEKKELTWNALKIYCWKNNKKVFGRRALKIIAPYITRRRQKKGTWRCYY